MTIQQINEQTNLPLDKEAIVQGGLPLFFYLRKLVSEIEMKNFEIHRETINLLVSIFNGEVIYLGIPDNNGVFPNGTWRIRINDDGELSREKKVSGTFVPVLVDDV